MSETKEDTFCGDCGRHIEDDPGSGDPAVRKPCPDCGSTVRSYHVFVFDTLELRDGIGLKAKHQGAKKPYVETLNLPEHSHRLGKLVHKERVIDRENNHYFERVTDYESGQVIHENSEPLSDHFGHGSAKKK